MYYEKLTNGKLRPKQITEPGIYFDMPDEVYFAQHAVSQSGMKNLLKSPWHFWASHFLTVGAKKESKALNVGKKFHTYLLERGEFFNRYTLKVKKDGSSYAGATGTCEETGREYIGSDELTNIKAAVQILEAHMPKTFLAHVKNARKEVVLIWRCERTGVLCRGKCDIYSPFILFDYKTAQEVTPRQCVRQVSNYDYIIQAAFYTDGNRWLFKHKAEHMKAALGISDKECEEAAKGSNFAFLFQEKEHPFTPFSAAVGEAPLQKGREEYGQALDIFKANFEKYGFSASKPWPAFGDKVYTLDGETFEFYGQRWRMFKEFSYTETD